LLQDWGLIEIKNKYEVNETSDVVVISFAEKSNWNCRSKYSIGNKNVNYQNEVEK
jgi:hypothetical protein